VKPIKINFQYEYINRNIKLRKNMVWPEQMGGGYQ